MSDVLMQDRSLPDNPQGRLPFGPYWRLLSRYLKPQRAAVSIMAVLLLLGIAVQLANPQVIRYFLDSVQSSGPQRALLEAAGLFLGFAFLQQALQFGANYLSESVGWNATNQLRADLANHCLRLDMSFHKQHTPGELIERIDGDVTALGNFFSKLAVQVLGNGLLAAGILILLFKEDLRLGLGITAYTLLTLSTLVAIQPLAVRRWVLARQASAEQYGFLEERIQGKEDIRSSGAEAYVMQRLYQLMGNLLKKSRSAFVISAMTYSVTDLLAAGGRAFGLALGATLYTSGNLSIGGAYLVLYYLGLLSTPLHGIREQAQDLQHASASIQRIQALFQAKTDTQDTATEELSSHAIAVEFQDVSFQYDEIVTTGFEPESFRKADPPESEPSLVKETRQAAPALQNVTFTLQANKVLGVLGRTGSGKTTLTRLMYRLYSPGSGKITLNGTDLKDLSTTSLRSKIGIVTQDVQLFQATLRDNLTFFDRSISDQRLEQALLGFSAMGVGPGAAQRVGHADRFWRSGHIRRRGPIVGAHPPVSKRSGFGDPG